MLKDIEIKKISKGMQRPRTVWQNVFVKTLPRSKRPAGVFRRAKTAPSSTDAPETTAITLELLDARRHQWQQERSFHHENQLLNHAKSCWTVEYHDSNQAKHLKLWKNIFKKLAWECTLPRNFFRGWISFGRKLLINQNNQTIGLSAVKPLLGTHNEARPWGKVG